MSAFQSSPVDAGAPVHFEDGTEALVRPISPADSGALLRFHSQLSAGSVRLRYFNPHPELSSSEVTRFTEVDGIARAALVVECAHELVAVGRYDQLGDHEVAEVAFVVADAYQHRGLATMLLHRLAAAARSIGIKRFTAEVLAENWAMLSVFRHAGFPIESKTDQGTVELMMTIAPDLTDTKSD